MEYDFSIISSNDSRIRDFPYQDEDILEETDEYLKLKYQKGCFYEILIKVKDTSKEITKKINIKK